MTAMKNQERFEALLYIPVRCPECEQVMLRTDNGKTITCCDCGSKYKAPTILLEPAE